MNSRNGRYSGDAQTRALQRAALLLISIVASFYLAAPSWGGPADIDAGRRAVEQLGLADWMGPLAPIALSPFFGLMCLSGAALLVERGLLPPQALLSNNAALQNESVFLVLLGLTVFTSLPRLTKVTKPVAQLADFLETYAGIVYVLVIFWAARAATGPEATAPIAAAGIADTSGWLLMAIVAAANILAIQTIRLFFEMLVWLSPFPLVDAAFEAANKAFCAGLIALYVFSPAAAFAVDLALFAVCALFARAAYRRLRAFRQNTLLPLWRRLRGGRFRKPHQPSISGC